MNNLKNSLLILSLCFPLSSCQSMTNKAFRIETFPATERSGAEDLHIIHVRSDRLRQECIFLNAEAENNWRHQYFIYILNDKNEVLELIQPTHMDKDSCSIRISKTEKILEREPQVKVCARDTLKKSTDPEITNKFIHFGSLGKHSPTYEYLTLDTICNSKKCLSNNEVWVNTCPGFEKQ